MRLPVLAALGLTASLALADKTEPKVIPPGDKPSAKRPGATGASKETK